MVVLKTTKEILANFELYIYFILGKYLG